MKKTIKILGLVFGFVGIVGGILCLFLGIYALNNPDVIKTNAPFLSKFTEEQYVLFCTAYIVIGGNYLSGSVFNFILSANAYNEKLSKGRGITLGVFGAILGARATGVLTIVDSAIHRHR